MGKIKFNVKDITIGTKLDLEVIDVFNSDKTNYYVSQLLDIKDDSRIVIAAPISEAKLAFVPNNAKIVVIVNHPKLGLVAFDTILLSKETIQNIAVFNLNVSGEFYKIQRRNQYRLNIMLDTYYSEVPVTTSSKVINAEEIEYTKTFTKDISGSGACFVSQDELAPGTMLVLKTELPDGNTVEARCTVVRCINMSTGGIKKYHIGVRYTAISKTNEEKLIRYIFIKQKEILRQKRM